MTQAKIRILDPVGALPPGGKPLAPLLDGVGGSRVGFRVQWPSFDIFMERIGELLRDLYGVKSIDMLYTGSDGTAAGKVSIRGRSDAVSWDRTYDALAGKVDWAVSGLAA
ncbi:MAG: hypothetical protein FJY55_10640 [Betaproteobacteria bacterium]|nr:hypothetical protein [Betaproteobacteria bacterium]